MCIYKLRRLHNIISKTLKLSKHGLSLRWETNTQTSPLILQYSKPSIAMNFFVFGSLALLLLLCIERSASSAEYPLSGNDHKDLASDDNLFEIYEGWMRQYGKVYNESNEKQKRFNIFKNNLLYINAHNQKNQSYLLGLNYFADLVHEEFESLYVSKMFRPSTRPQKISSSHRYQYALGDELPASIDWREKGAVTDVKTQGPCGCCWAFSAIAAVEGVNFLATNMSISLSEQELLDCDRSFNEGCTGGLMDEAFKFIIQNHGIDSEADYPYVAKAGVCNISKESSSAVTIDNYGDVQVNDEMSLQKAVSKQPISVGIEGSGMDFKFYQSGIFTGECGVYMDHAVTLVGYGSTETDYWIAKNSWGPNWGENGYIRLARNIGSPYGTCGIALTPSYPIKITAK